MHMASGNRYFNIVKLLVEQGATVDSRNNNEQTTLDYCREWVSRYRALLDRDWRARVCPGLLRVNTTSQRVDMRASPHRASYCWSVESKSTFGTEMDRRHWV